MFLFLAAALAQNAASERAYQRTVDLIDGLYLYPERVDAPAMLHGGADSLSDALHWLMVDQEGTAVNLRHGNGTLIGSVSVASVETLPAALASVENLVRGAGIPLGEVDVRLELLKGVTVALDRYSRVLAGDRLDRFDVRLKGTLVGVGLTVSIRPDGEGQDTLEVTQVNPDGPASKGDIHIGDVITRIDGRSTVNMPTSEATRRIRGEADSTVTMTLDRDGTEVVAKLKRAEIVLPNVESRVLADDIGYVRISHVSQRTVQNLLGELESLKTQGALEKGLVLDLRGNTGGSMKESARTVDQFVEQGLLLRTAGPDGNQVRNLQARMEANEGGAIPDIPVAILVDERTASGAEIVAGALLELERAALIGTRSYGKGTVQKIYPLASDMRLKLTVAQYLLAHDRVIADLGLVPDVVVGEVELDSYGVHYEDWDEERNRTVREDILPWVREAWSWREQEQPSLDLVEELGRRSVLNTTGPSRESLLTTLNATSKTVRAEQEAHLVEALTDQGIDWSPATESAAGPVPVKVLVNAVADPEDPDVILVESKVTNTGDLPLHRVQVELAATFRVWDGLVMPIGRLDPGATLSGTVRVGLNPGVNPREDDVQVSVRAQGHATTETGAVALHAESSAQPQLEATVRLVGEGRARRAQVEVHNPTQTLLEGLEVHFGYPGDIDVELVDRAARVPSLAPGARHTFDLEVALGPNAPDLIPLKLVIEAGQFGKLHRWPFEVKTDGTPVALREPSIRAKRPLFAPVGGFAVPLVVSDDQKLDHVVVFHDGRKIAWAPGTGPTLELTADVELKAGRNRIVVVGVDDQGLSQRSQFVIRGVETDDAVAEPTP